VFEETGLGRRRGETQKHDPKTADAIRITNSTLPETIFMRLL
jgi:hypothetical protein